MKKIFFLLFLAVFLSVFIIFSSEKWKKTEVKIKGVSFQAEKVTNPEEIRTGLSGRKNLARNEAMLFMFGAPGKHSFWMKGMQFDLDIIWIQEDKVVFIARNFSHDSEESILPDVLADKVLEINSGLADELGISVGDEIEMK